MSCSPVALLRVELATDPPNAYADTMTPFPRFDCFHPLNGGSHRLHVMAAMVLLAGLLYPLRTLAADPARGSASAPGSAAAKPAAKAASKPAEAEADKKSVGDQLRDAVAGGHGRC